MWYGYVAPGLNKVTEDFDVIRNWSRVMPYSKFRKFRSEEEAWDFVKRNKMAKDLVSIKNYGDCFDNLYLKCQYFITAKSVCYNVFTDNIGFVKVETEDPNILIENRLDVIKIKMTNIRLNNDLISSHSIAIYNLLEILGDFVDVNIEVPDQSIYYMMKAYTGTKPIYLKLQQLMKRRRGEISVTLKEW